MPNFRTHFDYDNQDYTVLAGGTNTKDQIKKNKETREFPGSPVVKGSVLLLGQNVQS